MTSILFIGAHPDDLEIGAGGTIARMCSRGHDVTACVLTSESDPKTARRRAVEARNGLKELGVRSTNMIFLGLPDGNVEAKGPSVHKLREALSKSKCNPDIVVTHSDADSHNDHREVRKLVLATFRGKIILGFPVVNSLLSSSFAPRFFVDTSKAQDAVTSALKRHVSQIEGGRIHWEELRTRQSEWAEIVGCDSAEAFDIEIQQGAESSITNVLALSDSAFHRFWFPVLGDRRLANIHGVPVFRRKKEFNWAIDKDREGMSRLRRAFETMWFGGIPIDEYSSGTEIVEESLSSDVLFSGSSVSNSISRTYFNHFEGIRYVVDFDMPDYRRIRICDRSNHKSLFAEYVRGATGENSLRLDRAILTIMKNPMTSTGRHLIGCMGIHGYGGLACYRVLSEGKLLSQLLSRCEFPFPAGIRGYQVLLGYDNRLDELEFDWKSLYRIPGSADSSRT